MLNETNNALSNDVEVQLASMELESANEKGLAMCALAKMDVLKDRDMWIADSRATSHNTPHVAGLYDLKKPLQ